MLDYAKAAPLSWFFSMCYRVGSAVMDAKSRARIQLVKDSEVSHILNLLKILECCNWSDIYWFLATRLCKIEHHIKSPSFAQVKSKLHPLFAPETLPPHLYGTSTTYTSSIDVLFDPASVTFPPRK